MNELLNRLRVMSGLEPIAEAVEEKVEDLIIEKKINDEDEDDEDSKESKVRRLTDRYRRGNANRENGVSAKTKADQDDAFKCLTNLLGGADKAAKHIMAANESAECEGGCLSEKELKLGTVDSIGGGAVAAKMEADGVDAPKDPIEPASPKHDVPSEVTGAISKRISELKSAIEKYDDKGYNDDSSKTKAVECLEKLLSNLKKGDEDGFQAAQIYLGTLMSPITNLFPPKVIKFLSSNTLVKQSDGHLKAVKEGFDWTAEEDANGNKRWYNKNGELHRDDGPAIEYVNGTKFWYKNGQKHRDDGPAEEYADGTKYWYKNDQLHRDDGPAIENTNGDKRWFKNGQRYNPS